MNLNFQHKIARSARKRLRMKNSCVFLAARKILYIFTEWEFFILLQFSKEQICISFLNNTDTVVKYILLRLSLLLIFIMKCVGKSDSNAEHFTLKMNVYKERQGGIILNGRFSSRNRKSHCEMKFDQFATIFSEDTQK